MYVDFKDPTTWCIPVLQVHLVAMGAGLCLGLDIELGWFKRDGGGGASVFVSFSGLHKSQQFRGIVGVVSSVLVITVAPFVLYCTYFLLVLPNVLYD